LLAEERNTNEAADQQNHSSQIALLTIACFLQAIVGCGRAPTGSVFIRVTDPRGQLTEKEFTGEEFATSAKASLDQLIARDQEAIDPAQILREGTVTLKLASGKVLELKTEGNRVVLANGPNSVSLSWNADRTQLTYQHAVGELASRPDWSEQSGGSGALRGKHRHRSVRGARRSQPERFDGSGRPTVLRPLRGVHRPHPRLVVCITAGTWICTEQAYRICTYGVKDVWMNCGVTYHNGWQFGFGCTIECW
jgi:hypothetical protein